MKKTRIRESNDDTLVKVKTRIIIISDFKNVIVYIIIMYSTASQKWMHEAQAVDVGGGAELPKAVVNDIIVIITIVNRDRFRRPRDLSPS